MTSVLDAAIDGVVYASVDEVIEVPDVHARLNDLYMASCDPTDGRERRPRQSAPLTFLKADATKVDKRAERVRAADGTVRHVGDVPDAGLDQAVSPRLSPHPFTPRPRDPTPQPYQIGESG